MRQTHQKSEDKKEKGHTAHRWEKIAAYIFGVAFSGVILSIAVFIPAPTDFQVFVFRVVLALAASGIGAVVPGFLHVEWKPKTKLCIRAGGAIALFLIVYFINPPALLSDTPGNIRANYIGKVTIHRTFSGNTLQQKTKTKKIRILPLDDDVHAMLLKMRNLSGFIFVFDNKPYAHHNLLSRIWEKALQSAGIEHVKLYAGTRHSFASQAGNNDVGICRNF